MSESTSTEEQSKKVYNVTFPCARIAWPAFDCDYGHVPECKLDIEPQISARIDVWLCTPCEAYPDGYFVSINDPNNPYMGEEPGDTSNNKHLLCKIVFNGVSDITAQCIQEEIDRNMGRNVRVEYWNRRLPTPKKDELLPPPRIVPFDFTTESAILIDDVTPEFVENGDHPTIPSENAPSTVTQAPTEETN